MAFRGRGRGRGYGGGGGFSFARQEAFELFPDVELPDINGVTEEKALIIWNSRLLNYWKSSPYYLEAGDSKKNESTDIERYSDLAKRVSTTKGSFSQFLQLNKGNFPLELLEGKLRKQKQKVRWNPNADLKKLDFFEKLEEKFQGKVEAGEKDKNESENEDADEEGMEPEDEEFSDDGDYNQNIDFDDDEDDFNMADDNDDEAIY